MYTCKYTGVCCCLHDISISDVSSLSSAPPSIAQPFPPSSMTGPPPTHTLQQGYPPQGVPPTSVSPPTQHLSTVGTLPLSTGLVSTAGSTGLMQQQQLQQPGEIF